MKYFFIIISLVFVVQIQAALAQNSALIDSLKYNVIKIKATFVGETTQSGFGFIVGADEQFEYFVTANHVVRKINEPALNIKVTFYDKNRSKQYAQLLEKSDESLDLALLKVVKRRDEFGLWRRDALGLVETGADVWFLGQGSKWVVPNQPGQVATKSAECATVFDSEATISVENMKTRKGTSGAPLISNTGIVGMMLCSGKKQVALSIDRIRERLQSDEWNIAWGLHTRKVSADLTGTWSYWDEWDGENAQLDLIRLDDAHYSFKANSFLGLGLTIGKAVIDGNTIYSEFRSRAAGDVSALLTIQECSKGYAMFASGIAYDHNPDEAPYKMRLKRIDKKAINSTSICPVIQKDVKSVSLNLQARSTAKSSLPVQNNYKSTPAVIVENVQFKQLQQKISKPVAAEPKFPGCWKWSNGAYIVIDANGTAYNGSIGATWKAVDIASGRYTITWPSFVDMLTLSTDGSTLSGTNNLGVLTSATRKFGEATGLVGSWLWSNGITVEIRPDSSVIGGPFKGAWYKAGNNWIIEWPLVDAVSLSADGHSLSVKNQFGVLRAKRDTSCKGGYLDGIK